MRLLSDKKLDTRSLPLSAKQSLSFIHVAAAALIALMAFGLRLSFIGFPTDRNADEPLVARLAMGAAQTGRFTANWAGVMKAGHDLGPGAPLFYWDRSTYQFSPHTLLEELFHWALYHTTGWPRSKDDHIYCARGISSAWGALGVFFVFLATWNAFWSLPGAFLAEAILALSPLHVEDSMFARVDAFVCFLVILCFFFVSLAMQRNGTLFRDSVDDRPETTWRPGPWTVAAALVAGIAISAKYNAAPVLMLVLWIPAGGWWRARLSVPAACIQAIAIVAIAGAGFVVATPEMITDARPLFEGMSWELGHYREGHIPFQAHGFGDNNLFYWSWYLSRLGFGLLPLMAAVLFLPNFHKSRSLAGALLASYLLVAGVLTILPRVRFERNFEVILGPLAIASALGFMIFHKHMVRKGQRASLALTVICVVLFFAQPVRTLFDIRDLIWPRSPVTRYLEAPRVGKSCYSDMMAVPNPKARNYANVFLADYNDPFSASNRLRWFEVLGVEHETMQWHSKWSEHGYPFSSLDVNFGPARLYLIQKPVAKQDKHAGRRAPGTGATAPRRAGSEKSDASDER
jgi:hypothetical protein